jgi:hypothetical protein
MNTIDENLVTPSDYTILIYNLPQIVNIKELKHHLESIEIKGIKQILIPYRVKENIEEIEDKIKVLYRKKFN